MSDKLDMEITEILLKNALEEYENEECDEIIEKYKDTEPEYSEKHNRRMKKLFKKEKRASSWKKNLLRAAMIILAVFISCAAALQVEAVRVRIENWYYEVTGEAIHIGNSTEDLPGYSESGEPVYVLSEEFVEKYGFSVIQEINGRRIITEYFSINDTYIILRQYNEERYLDIDNEKANMDRQQINGKNVIVTEKDDELTLCWKENDTFIYCFTNLAKDEICEIVENIVRK